MKTVTGVNLPADYLRSAVDTFCYFDGIDVVADRQLQIGSNSVGDWHKHADGNLIQYGGDTGLSGSTGAVITLPVAYSEGGFTIQLTPQNINPRFPTYAGVSVSEFEVRVWAVNETQQTTNFKWLTLGKWY